MNRKSEVDMKKIKDKIFGSFPLLGRILGWILCAIIPVLAIFWLEITNKLSRFQFWEWYQRNALPFYFALMIGILLFLMMIAVTGRIYIGIPLTLLGIWAVGQLHVQKRNFLGDPLYPWDFYQIRNAINIIPHLNLTMKWSVLAALRFLGFGSLVLFGLWLIYYGTKKFKIHPVIRICAVGSILSFLFYLGFTSHGTKTVLPKFGIRDIVWDQRTNYSLNGFTTGFFINLKYSWIQAPPGYGKRAIQTFREQFTVSSAGDEAWQENRRPHLIFIMNEAFWDPKRLPNVEFSKDPIPNFTRLSKEHPSFDLVVNAIGGKTANIEFEVLTGFSTRFLPVGSVPYNQYVSRPMRSMVSVLKQRGYRTVAVHPYYKWYYMRERVYQHLGFEEFIGAADFINPQYRGKFISDVSLSEKIIEEFERTEAQKPMFLFSVSMQNHGPYKEGRYDTPPLVTVSSDFLKQENLEGLQTFTQGMYEADASLQILVEYFKEKEEPVAIVFFGDHLPMLGYGYSTYVQTGFLSTAKEEDWSLQERMKMYSVPLLLWTNFEVDRMDYESVGANYLFSVLFEGLGMGQEPFERFLSTRFQDIRASIRNLTVDAKEQLSHEMPEDQKILEEIQRLLQYDLMFGKQYFLSISE
jgi:phosphoglycerol transferase MdoB-like AlkP superfamily enzyme